MCITYTVQIVWIGFFLHYEGKFDTKSCFYKIFIKLTLILMYIIKLVLTKIKQS